MHAIAPYLFRCYNKSLEGKREQRYSCLNSIGQYDLFNLLKDFIDSNSGSYNILEDTKQVYQFNEMSFDVDRREITGWFNVGTYGTKNDIINVETGLVDFQKAQNNAEIIKHYVHIFIPLGFNEAMAFMHSYRGIGVKTLFYSLFSNYFSNITHLSLQMNPLAYDNAMDAWLDGDAKEVKLTKFAGVPDIADQIQKLGHSEQELVIKAPRKGKLGRLRDYVTGGNEKLQAIEIIGEYGSQVKTVIEINGKRRTFSVGRNKTTALCEIELDDDIVYIEGNPELQSIRRWVTKIVSEYTKSVYPGLSFEVLR